MKKIFIPLIVLGGVIATLGVFAGAIIANGTCTMKYHGSSVKSDWMGDLADSKKLNDVVMPGSHDAGTNTMNWLGRTQAFSVKNQLKDGCRYFDIRTNNTNGEEDGLVIYHSIIDGQKFSTVLNEIDSFIRDNPTETLILDFQHFKNGAADLTYNFLKTKIGDCMVSKPSSSTQSDLEFVDSLTLGDTRGKCLVFWGEEIEMANSHNDLFARNDDSSSKTGMSLNSEYNGDLHKKNSKTFIQNALPSYFDHIEAKIAAEGHKGMFVLQCQLTDGYLIFGPWSREKTHTDNLKKYISEIKNDARRISLLNIVMCDFVNDTLSEGIISLNNYK